MSDHLSSSSLLNIFQSAYEPRHNTEMPVVDIVNDLLCSLDKGHFSVVTFFDLSAEFRYHRSQHFTKPSWACFRYTRCSAAMVRLIPVQQNSNCLHQQLNVWSCSCFLLCSSGLCPWACSVRLVYHTHLWCNWRSLHSSKLFYRWRSVKKICPTTSCQWTCTVHAGMHPRCQIVDVQQETETVWWHNRNNDCVLSDNVNVFTHARFSYSRYFKCHVFSVYQNSRYDTRYTSVYENPGCKSSKNCRFRTPTHYFHSLLSFSRSYTAACLSLCHVPTRLLSLSSLWLSPEPHQHTSESSEQCRTLTNSTLTSSRCKNTVQNLLSLLQCYQLFWPSILCWPA